MTTLPQAATDVHDARTLADEAYEQLVAADSLTTTELQALIDRAGRSHGPNFLATAYSEGIIDDQVVTASISGIWSMTERPDRDLDHDTWRWLFGAAGFTVDGEQKPRPSGPMTLYRGSVPERRTDWSWSRDIKVALKFAAGVRGRPPGRLWVCSVPPESMLAINTQRDEDEIVVDTRGLNICEALR